MSSLFCWVVFWLRKLGMGKVFSSLVNMWSVERRWLGMGVSERLLQSLLLLFAIDDLRHNMAFYLFAVYEGEGALYSDVVRERRFLPQLLL